MPNYKYYNYESIGNTLEVSGTPVYPFNTHLLWEHATYGIIFVRHDDQTKLVITADEGATDCVNIDLTGATSKKIQSGWLDGNDLWLVCCDNPDNEFTVIYVELDNSNNVVDVGDSSGGDAGTVYAFDIFKLGSDHYVINTEERTGTITTVVWDVDATPFVEKDDSVVEAITYIYKGITYADINYYTIGGTDDPSIHRILFTVAPTIGIDSPGLDAYTIPDDENQTGLAYDGDDTIYFVAKKVADGVAYEISFSIAGTTYTAIGSYSACLMVDRNVHGTIPPFTLEKGFDLADDKIYQIPAVNTGKLNLISVFDFDDVLKGITDNYVIDASSNLYQMVDMVGEAAFTHLFLDYRKKKVPKLEVEYRNDKIDIVNGLFMQFTGIFSADGSSTANSVVFEGKVIDHTENKLGLAVVINESDEIMTVSPTGVYEVDTDGLISAIISGFFDYTQEGTLQDGIDLGVVELGEGLKANKIFNGCAEMDGYLWAIRPQGSLDYDDSNTDSGADLLFEQGVNNDPIWGVEGKPSTLNANKIIVWGNINLITGIRYTGEWNDTDDQLIRGVIPVEYSDANLFSDAECLAKATQIGTIEGGGYKTYRLEFRKPSIGVIYPHQTITFKYVSTDLTVSQAQFIVDALGLDLLSEIGFLQISSGVIQ